MSLFSDPTFLTEWFMMAALLTVALAASYTDLAARLVPNRYTLGLLAVGVAGQLAMLWLGVTEWNRVLGVFLAGLVLAILLTLLGLWAPGDAKLFWAATVALPPSLCPSRELLSAQSAPVALVANALVCYLAFLLLVPLWRQTSGQVSATGASGTAPWLRAAAGMGALLGLTFAAAGLWLPRPLSYLEALAILVVGYRVVVRLVPDGFWPTFVIPGLATLAFSLWRTGDLQAPVLIWGVAWASELAYLRIQPWYHRAFVQHWPIQQLVPGTVLASTVTALPERGGEIIAAQGAPLTQQQILRLQVLAEEGRLASAGDVAIEQSFPFVPFITVSIVLTALFGGNLVPPLTKLLVWLGR